MSAIATTIQLEGLTCSACQKIITKKVSKIPDVLDVAVELSGKTEIRASRSIDEQEVRNVLEGTHYTVMTKH